MLCEDKKSGLRYLEDAKGHFRLNIIVKISHCGKTDPIGIVKEAINNRRIYDMVYCVIDRDTHEGFDEALRLADKSPGVVVVPSFPCFEFWYLLHFGFTRAPYSAAGNKSAGDCLVADLRKCDGMADYAKGGNVNIFELLLPRLEKAMDTSAKILSQAIQENSFNPSTRLHELLVVFEKLAQPQAA